MIDACARRFSATGQTRDQRRNSRAENARNAIAMEKQAEEASG